MCSGPGESTAPIDANIGRLVRQSRVAGDSAFAGDVLAAIRAVEVEDGALPADATATATAEDDYMMEAGVWVVWLHQ